MEIKEMQYLSVCFISLFVTNKLHEKFHLVRNAQVTAPLPEVFSEIRAENLSEQRIISIIIMSFPDNYSITPSHGQENSCRKLIMKHETKHQFPQLFQY